jgi:hypothetical protein
MALQEPIEPRSNNEPLLNDAAVDQSGRFRPWYRNLWERGKTQIGEIISGVNRNAENIAQLETDYQNGDSNLSAAILIEAGVRASADATAATSISTVTARLDGSEAARNQNALFQQDGGSGTGVPASWSSWDNGSGVFQANPVTGDGYSFKLAGGAGASAGIIQTISVTPGQKLLARTRVRREAGTFAGAGVYLNFVDGAVSGVGTPQSIVFATDADTSGNISSAPDGEVLFEKEIEVPTGAVSLQVYAMSHFSTFGSIAASNEISWQELSVSAVTNAQAQVSEQATAIADIEGNLSASYALTVDANGRIAQMRLLSDGTTSSVAFTADVFKIYDGSSDIAPFSVSGGVVTMQNVEINGNLMINGTVNTDQLASGAVTNSGVSQNTASASLTSGSYVEVIDLDFTSVGIGVEIRASCDVEVGAFTPGAPSAKIEWELRRGTTVLKSGSTNGATETTTPGGLTYNTVRGTVVVDYNDLPSSGTYNYNLRIQVTNGGGTPTQSATNRFISAREFKR